jgi:hypothetical protein
MGETNASLLGSMLTVKIYLAAMSRADEPAARIARLPRFYFYVDEFQSMMNEAFADILSESRKYKLALTLANQYIEQMEEEVRDAVFGNVGTLIVFRVGPFDAEVLETVFEPTFTPEDLVGLGIGQIYLTLMIDGVGSPPFSAETIPPIEPPNITYRDDVIVNSRAAYGRPRADVEATINKKQMEFIPPPREKKDRRSEFRPTGGGAGPVRGGIEPRAHFRTESDRAQAAAPPQRAEAPQPKAEAPRENREAREQQNRMTLKEAIEKARAQGAAPVPSKTPLDMMRERNQNKPKPQPTPHQARPEQRQAEQHRSENHQQSAPKHGQEARGAHEKPQEEAASRTLQEERARRDLHDGEVSPHVLQQVINGHHRDADDL